MNDLKNLISELFTIRKVPQFLYYDVLYPSGFLAVRKELLKFGEKNHSDKIDFILNSSGGSPDDAYRIIKLLRNHFAEVNIIVPFWAKSAATLLTLGGTFIIMNEMGELGPLDVQLRKEKDDSPEYDWESALNDESSLKRIEQRAQELYKSLYSAIVESGKVRIIRTELSKQIFEFVSSFYHPLLDQIDPYKIGSKKRKLDIGAQYANKVLLQYGPNLSNSERKSLVDYLVNECPDHGYIIDYEVLKIFLPNIKRSLDIGVEYDKVLTKISEYLMACDEVEQYIGFVPEIDELISDDGSNKKPNDNISTIPVKEDKKEVNKEALRKEIENEKLN